MDPILQCVYQLQQGIAIEYSLSQVGSNPLALDGNLVPSRSYILITPLPLRAFIRLYLCLLDPDDDL